ncbi:MAG: hypothetical protein BWK73_04660 [Thiothrix lacustris]|uniref:Uncharacterized protein n=1 Tax=Thiothrix lacustris TaxID=525917 RepID=A0A1Y1QXK5_9GAMM|nr:MAG: hypothetical protein BWK73_04660 [Thiothrix lacustris]
MSNFHGVATRRNPDGVRPITTLSTSAIGLPITAPNADVGKFPYHKPVRVASLRDAALLGVAGTGLKSLDALFKQGYAECVVVRVPEPTAGNLGDVIGGVDVTSGDYEGISALLTAEAEIGVRPRILIAPYFSHHKSVGDALVGVADKLRGYVYADGPDTTDAAAIQLRNEYGSERIRIHDPAVKTVFNGDEIVMPVSPFLAGARAALDQQRGWWWSLSNFELKGVTGTTRPSVYIPDDPTSRAQYLNANNVATIIKRNGYRCWGNRGCSNDPAWEFESIVRANDIISNSIDNNLSRWAVDRPINRAFFENVAKSVTAYLAYLQSIGAVLGGRCWVDWAKGTETRMANGEAYFAYDLTVPAPAEHIGLEYLHVTDYYRALIGVA